MYFTTLSRLRGGMSKPVSQPARIRVLTALKKTSFLYYILTDKQFCGPLGGDYRKALLEGYFKSVSEDRDLRVLRHFRVSDDRDLRILRRFRVSDDREPRILRHFFFLVEA